MRPMRRFGASGRLTRSQAGPAALGLCVIAATVSGLALTSGPALAVTAGQPGAAVAVANPATVTAGAGVTFQITCGSLQAASATLFGSTLGLAQQIPMNKESSGDVFTVTVTLPSSTRPGTYNPAIDCSDGSSALATVHVTAMLSGGGAQTGDGTTSSATNTGLSAGGLALIAVGAVAGGIALRRRSSTRS
jgi:hypothetical protein